MIGTATTGHRLAPTIAATESAVAVFSPASTQCWPGRTAAAILFAGCNLACAYCHCPELVARRHAVISDGDIVSRVSAIAPTLDGVVVTGGEPTAGPGLVGLVGRLDALGIPIRLDTNGTNPEVLTELLGRGLLSFVAMDVKTTPDRYRSVTGHAVWDRVRRSIDAVIASGVDHEFRTTCYPGALVTADLPHIARELEGGRRYVLQQFSPRRTLDPAAGSVRAYEPDALRRAALCCTMHIPTVVRGV